MTRNKEAILSEKDLSCHFGQTCLVGYAEPIDPSGFASFEEFMAAVQKAWAAEWRRVYSAQLSGFYTLPGGKRLVKILGWTILAMFEVEP